MKLFGRFRILQVQYVLGLISNVPSPIIEIVHRNPNCRRRHFLCPGGSQSHSLLFQTLLMGCINARPNTTIFNTLLNLEYCRETRFRQRAHLIVRLIVGYISTLLVHYDNYTLVVVICWLYSKVICRWLYFVYIHI